MIKHFQNCNWPKVKIELLIKYNIVIFDDTNHDVPIVDNL